jgi:flavin reductase (DIM6/NTAB) family NADH-FMN oxidoreductase RutF
MPSPEELLRIDADLRLIDREVWVVTSTHDGRRGGLVATWVSAASIDRQRPVLLAGIAPNHFTAELVQGSRAFAAHLLRPEQVELAWNFASGSGRTRDKLEGLASVLGQTGVPLLVDCFAHFECRVFARLDAGDRLFFWGDVISSERRTKSGSTVEVLREQAFIRALTDEQRQASTADREADARQNRPRSDRWRATNPW